MCQCPKTGNSHFHKLKVNAEYKIYACVNALRRATLISTEMPQIPKEGIMCQCPKTGNSHFHEIQPRL